MKKICIFLIIGMLISTPAVAEYKISKQDIINAEKTRAMAVKMGLNKVSSASWVSIAKKSTKKPLSKKQIAALQCMAKKAKEMQFNSPIKVYARYLADQEFEQKTDTENAESCGLKK